ncbi:PhzF family phenazine biosynthesis protein [Methylobacterium oryzisoli]|uniref:PhzF family phenazine biosynthesis protein n=1 Tax=Methylobacterium oryzisoli TaxID=3385502 RepID=UPI003892617A
MPARRFVTLDVFTERPLAGNPLAVVLDAEGLDEAAMQAIAREFNLSETVFVLPPREARHRAWLRIFTPAQELPFAGHPTVGTAVLLGLRDRRSEVADAVAFGLEEAVGTVSCVVEAGDGRGRARFRLPRLPEVWGEAEGLGPTPEDAAAALGLEPGDIGFSRHLPSRHSAGTPFDLVPVRTLPALGRARSSAASLDAAFGANAKVFLYTRETEDPAHGYRARMFAPGLGVPEDPATGAAVAAFAGALMQFEPLGDGTHDVVIAQGYEMGRPSEIALQLVIEAGRLRAAEIGGSAVVVAEGEIRV